MKFIYLHLILVILLLGIDAKVGKDGSLKTKSQEKLNLGLKALKDKEKIRLPKKSKKNRTEFKSSMRETTNEGFMINEIASLSFTVQQLEENSLEIESQFCPFVSGISCDPSIKYRSYNGTCNNLKNPLFGASNTPYKRFLAPAYDNQIDLPRTKNVNGQSLPNPRTISLTISPPIDGAKLELSVSQIYALFGQFLTHDLSATSATTDSNGNEIECSCENADSNCFSVEWPADDPKLHQSCMKMTRSSASFPDFDCSLTYREQLNLLTSYIDGSQIYGKDDERAAELRAFTNGKLKTSEPLANNNARVTSGSYLPLSDETCSSSSDPVYNCFKAGEFRTSENLGLVSMHTLFMREHNRIAEELALKNSHWNDETLYQETRKIIIALYQHVIFNEWLTMVSGDSSLAPNMQNTAYYNGYDEKINPALTNEFSTAAFRFGHSLINDKFSRYINDNDSIRPIFFNNMTFKSDLSYDIRAQGINSILKGIIKNNCWRFGTFGNELQNNLFGKIENNVFTAVDLLATNIQRGRDHGLKPYIHYVKECHAIDVKTFADLRSLMNRKSISLLEAVYGNVEDIDLYAGGLMEKKISTNNLVGQTFGCLIMKQFFDLKNGDRFFYENGPTINPSAFSLDQLKEIKKITFSGLICNNYDINLIPENAFLNPSENNPELLCSSIRNQVDLSKWIETQ